MILASRANGSKDGSLVVVHPNRLWGCTAKGIVPNLQSALDHWTQCEPLLAELSRELASGKRDPDLRLEDERLIAPLPRAFAWLDGSAYLNHVRLARQARGAEVPQDLTTNPLMYQGAGDTFLGPDGRVPLEQAEWGLDFEAELAVITGDIPMAAGLPACTSAIRLITLLNDWTLRSLIPGELAKGFGFVQSKPSTAFAPFAVTPDELGRAWDGARAHLSVECRLNGRRIGRVPTGEQMHFSFPQLIAHAARTRRLTAGTVIGGGTVSHSLRDHGSCCLVEKRMIETIESGRPTTPFLKVGDRITVETEPGFFGKLDQEVVAADLQF